MKKIKDLFRKAWSKLLRKKNKGAIRNQQFDGFYSDAHFSKKGGVSKEQITAMFRKMFAEAYPEMANFAERIQMMQGYNDVFELKGSLCASGHLSAYGLSTSYREWEENTVKEIESKYPDLKILAFHYTPENEGIDH